MTLPRTEARRWIVWAVGLNIGAMIAAAIAIAIGRDVSDSLFLAGAFVVTAWVLAAILVILARRSDKAAPRTTMDQGSSR